MEKNTNILLLECFMRGETSPDEEQILSDWLHSQEAKEQLSNYYQETWKGSNNKLIAEVQGRMFERVKSQMHNAVQELNRRKQKRTMRIRRLFQYAAVILLIITAGIGGHLYTVSQTEPTVTDKNRKRTTGKYYLTGRYSRLAKFIYSTALQCELRSHSTSGVIDRRSIFRSS